MINWPYGKSRVEFWAGLILFLFKQLFPLFSCDQKDNKLFLEVELLYPKQEWFLQRLQSRFSFIMSPYKTNNKQTFIDFFRGSALQTKLTILKFTQTIQPLSLSVSCYLPKVK